VAVADRNSNVLLVLIWFLAFLLVCIAYTFVLTTFFDNARTGGVVGMLLYLALFLPSLVVRKPSVPRALQLVCSLLPPTAFSLGNDILNAAEGSGVGLQFSNLFQDSSFGISMGECLVMVLVDVVIFSIMAWYVWHLPVLQLLSRWCVSARVHHVCLFCFSALPGTLIV